MKNRLGVSRVGEFKHICFDCLKSNSSWWMLKPSQSQSTQQATLILGSRRSPSHDWSEWEKCRKERWPVSRCSDWPISYKSYKFEICFYDYFPLNMPALLVIPSKFPQLNTDLHSPVASSTQRTRRFHSKYRKLGGAGSIATTRAPAWSRFVESVMVWLSKVKTHTKGQKLCSVVNYPILWWSLMYYKYHEVSKFDPDHIHTYYS